MTFIHGSKRIWDKGFWWLTLRFNTPSQVSQSWVLVCFFSWMTPSDHCFFTFTLNIKFTCWVIPTSLCVCMCVGVGAMLFRSQESHVAVLFNRGYVLKQVFKAVFLTVITRRESLGEASSVAKGKCHAAGSASHPFQPCLSQSVTSLSAHTTTLKKCPHSATNASWSLEGLPAPGPRSSSDGPLFPWILAPSGQMAFLWDPLGVTVPGPSPRTRTRLRFSKSYRYDSFILVAREAFSRAGGPLQVSSGNVLNSHWLA